MSFEQEFLDELEASIQNGSIRVEPSDAEYFSVLNDMYPTIGARLDWSKVPDAIHGEAGRETYPQDCIRFFKTMRDKYLLQGECVVIGDNAIHVAISGPIEKLAPALERILEYPQHHYIFPRDYSWLMSFTFEGDMFLGFPPVSDT